MKKKSQFQWVQPWYIVALLILSVQLYVFHFRTSRRNFLNPSGGSRKMSLSETPFVKECVVEQMGGREKDNYGAWSLCTNRLKPGDIIYSFGIGGDVSFDNAMLDRDLQVFGFDPTISPEKVSRMFLEHHNKADPVGFVFKQIGLGAEDGVVSFLQSKNPKIQSMTALGKDEINANFRDGGFKAAVLRLKTILCMLGHERVAVVKMDVEGVEMDVCNSQDFRALEIPADQILIEFHERMIKNGVAKKAACIELLREKGFEIVHQSRNKQEMAFARVSPAMGSNSESKN